MESTFTFDIVLQRNRHSCGGADTDWIDCPIHEEDCSALVCWDCNFMEKDCEDYE